MRFGAKSQREPGEKWRHGVRSRYGLLAAVALLVGAIGGCGVYSASSGRVDEGLKRIAIEYFENMTAEPDIGVELSELITTQVQLDNTLKVVDETAADTILSGKVMRYTLRELAARQDLTVTEYQVQIAVTLTLTKRATGEKIFENRRFTGTGNYLLNDTNLTESSARDEAAGEIVRDILGLVVEDW